MTSRISQLDAAGFLPAPGETEEEFLARTRAILDRHSEFEHLLTEEKELTVFDNITVSETAKIDPQILTAASEVTWDLYRFKTAHVPGFFLSRSIGLLWGGCLIGDPDENFSLFLIRNAFRTRERWMFYRRTELFAHELCHSMRLDLRETTLEEYFAYQTSPSTLRRYLGNCFIHDWDAIFFVVPTLLLLAAVTLQNFFNVQIPVLPFWILAFLYPVFLLIRNAKSRRLVHNAGKKLQSFGAAHCRAILFRSTREELQKICALENAGEFSRFADDLAQKELRWQIIKERFITGEE